MKLPACESPVSTVSLQPCCRDLVISVPPPVPRPGFAVPDFGFILSHLPSVLIVDAGTALLDAGSMLTVMIGTQLDLYKPAYYNQVRGHDKPLETT